ncbi:hypothetical protein GALMADRAFT_1200770 [Galerina marginata CBS 339.88]|uniref:Zinc finger PHD-type domain-containing protein n=1 Tax=Galerina marginata (strain CBS 339.88) TaxID=685588 RepID=A0A067TNE3_GALM3|nr:hypothetical protein GALMADRAFT_1200770 [Galerina marginata CBS 339.88]
MTPVKRTTRHTYHDEFDDDVDDLPENRFEEFDDDSPLSTAPASSSATTTRPPPRSHQCPSGRRQELTWKPLEADTSTLKDISRQLQSFLNFHRSTSEPILSRRRGRYRVRTSHRCPGYSRIEVTLTTDILRSAIVSYSSPTPGEICPVCKEVVEEEILSCLCGNFDDETMPTVRCSTCFEWHHRPCVGGFGTEKFVCRRCNVSVYAPLSTRTSPLTRPARARSRSSESRVQGFSCMPAQLQECRTLNNLSISPHRLAFPRTHTRALPNTIIKSILREV